MAIVNVKIHDALYNRFKMAIAEGYGGKKGDLTKAVGEAIELWLKHEGFSKI